MSTTATTPTTTLAHVNTPPAETWNHLRINDVSLAVAAPAAGGTVPARLPRAFAHIECGVGAEAARWVEAVSGDATFLEVKAGVTRTEPIVVAVGGGEHADAGVLVREGAAATVVILALDDNDARATDGTAPNEGVIGSVSTGDAADTNVAAGSATLVRVIAERGARVRVVELVCNRAARTHVGGIGITAADDAAITVHQYALGHGTCALGIATELAGTAATLTHTMRYVVDGATTLDVNHVVRQRGRATEATVTTAGVLADGATKTLRETIDLVRGAKGATGSELESVLVAGERVVNKTLPTILCDEEDVAGNHGASIGGVSDAQRAYLAARGLGDDDVNALFMRAVIDDALAHVPGGAARAAICARAADIMGAELAADIAEMHASAAATDGGARATTGRG